MSFDIFPDTLPAPESVPLGALPVASFLPQEAKQNMHTAKIIKNKTVLLFFMATDFSFHATVLRSVIIIVEKCININVNIIFIMKILSFY